MVGLPRAYPVMHASASNRPWPKAPKQRQPTTQDPPIRASWPLYLMSRELTYQHHRSRQQKSDQRNHILVDHLGLVFSKQCACATVCLLSAPAPDLGATRGFSLSSFITRARCLRTLPSALTWLRLSTPSPDRPGTEPPKVRLATTSACICCGATNCAAPLPSRRVPTHHSNRLGAHPAQSTGTK